MPIYAFCGILAAKVNLLKAISYTETGFWPDGRAYNTVSSGEKAIWPDDRLLGGDGNHLR